MNLIVQANRKTLVDYSEYQEKAEHFMNLLAQAGGKDSQQLLGTTSP